MRCGFFRAENLSELQIEDEDSVAEAEVKLANHEFKASIDSLSSRSCGDSAEF